MNKKLYQQPIITIHHFMATRLMDSGSITESIPTNTFDNGELDARDGDGDWEDSPWEE